MAKNTGDANRLIIPGASWLTVKRIIRAYGAAAGEDSSGEEIANLGGLQRTVISACSKFLRGYGIVQTEKNSLTVAGSRLLTAWDIENQPMACEALQEIILSSSPLAQLVGVVRARGQMSMDLFKGQIIASAGLKSESFLLPFVKTIIDMLEESRLIQINDDDVYPGRQNGGPPRRDQERSSVEGSHAPRPGIDNGDAKVQDGCTRTPLPFGPSRLGFIELPRDWDNKELPKLLKMLELIFGGD